MYIKSKWNNQLNSLLSKERLCEADWHIYDMFLIKPEWTQNELHKETGFNFKLIESSLNKLIKEELICKSQEEDLYYNPEYYEINREEIMTEIDLISNYPILLDGVIEISVPPGWEDIVEKAIILLEKERQEKNQQLRVVQIKEKFGGLRIYTEQSDETTNITVSFFERMSWYVCEICGSTKNVNRASYGGWISTKCIACRTK